MSLYEGVKEVGAVVSQVNSAIVKATEGKVAKEFRTYNVPCVILDDGCIHPIYGTNKVRDDSLFEAIVENCFRDGYVRLEVSEEGEKFRIVPLGRVLEFTLGSKDPDDNKLNQLSNKLRNSYERAVNNIQNSNFFGSNNP